MSPRRRPATTLAAVLLAGALTTGCDSVQPKPSVTQSQAEARVAERAEEALRQLPAGGSLKTSRSEPKMPCDNSAGDRTTFVDVTYQIEYPPGWPVDQVIPTLAGYWTGKGWETVLDDREVPKTPQFSVENPDDGFRIGVQVTYRDNGAVDAYLLSSSPCL